LSIYCYRKGKKINPEEISAQVAQVMSNAKDSTKASLLAVLVVISATAHNNKLSMMMKMHEHLNPEMNLYLGADSMKYGATENRAVLYYLMHASHSWILKSFMKNISVIDIVDTLARDEKFDKIEKMIERSLIRAHEVCKNDPRDRPTTFTSASELNLFSFSIKYLIAEQEVYKPNFPQKGFNNLEGLWKQFDHTLLNTKIADAVCYAFNDWLEANPDMALREEKSAASAFDEADRKEKNKFQVLAEDESEISDKEKDDQSDDGDANSDDESLASCSFKEIEEEVADAEDEEESAESS
jgi:hypothetical protein